jgi:type IV secretion system protein VirB4
VVDLENNVKQTVGALNDMGIISVREDIKFEECYWSQLPANFEFLRRLKPINTNRIGGFASISNLPAGLANGSQWGPPVTVLKTAAQTPYFFNFHVKDNGHAVIVGPDGAGKTVLLNFLLSESRKLDTNIFFIDQNNSAEAFLRSIDADYYSIERSTPGIDEKKLHPPKLNPLWLDDTPENKDFLLEWLDILLQADKFYRPEMSTEFSPIFQETIDYIFTLNKEERNLRNIITYFKDHHSKVAAKFYGWYEGGEFEHLFSEQDDLDISGALAGFEIGKIIKKPNNAAPIIAYLMHRINATLDGKPTIIVLDEAWELLNTAYLKNRLEDWLDNIRNKNGLVILATSKPEDAIESTLSAKIMPKIATQFFLPNQAISPADYANIFNLTAKEIEYVYSLSQKKRQFLLKRGSQTIVAELKLDGLEHLIGILAADEPCLKLMNNLIKEYGSESQNWLHRFFNQFAERNTL